MAKGMDRGERAGEFPGASTVRFEHQIVIHRPVSIVFAYMDDVSREREWQPGILEARKEPPGPTAVGTRKHYVSEFMGRRIENTYVTRVFEPNEHVLYETTSGSVLQAKAELRWEPVDHGTRVTMGFDGKVGGALRLVPQKLLEGVYRKELETTLRLLKERLEGVGQ
jgi:carbon monoxide dehydrogenase subunit G